MAQFLSIAYILSCCARLNSAQAYPMLYLLNTWVSMVWRPWINQQFDPSGFSPERPNPPKNNPHIAISFYIYRALLHTFRLKGVQKQESHFSYGQMKKEPALDRLILQFPQKDESYHHGCNCTLKDRSAEYLLSLAEMNIFCLWPCNATSHPTRKSCSSLVGM